MFAADKHHARDQVWSRSDGFVSFLPRWWVPVPCSLPEAEDRAGHGSTSSAPGCWHSQVVLKELIPASLINAIHFHPPGVMIPNVPSLTGSSGPSVPTEAGSFCPLQSLASPELFLELS